MLILSKIKAKKIRKKENQCRGSWDFWHVSMIKKTLWPGKSMASIRYRTCIWHDELVIWWFEACCPQCLYILCCNKEINIQSGCFCHIWICMSWTLCPEFIFTEFFVMPTRQGWCHLGIFRIIGIMKRFLFLPFELFWWFIQTLVGWEKKSVGKEKLSLWHKHPTSCVRQDWQIWPWTCCKYGYSLDICCHISHRCFNFTITYPGPSKELKRTCNSFHNKINLFWLLGIYISVHLKFLPSCGLCVTTPPPDYHAVSQLLWLFRPQVFHLHSDIPTPLFSACAPFALLVYHLQTTAFFIFNVVFVFSVGAVFLLLFSSSFFGCLPECQPTLYPEEES